MTASIQQQPLRNNSNQQQQRNDRGQLGNHTVIDVQRISSREFDKIDDAVERAYGYANDTHKVEPRKMKVLGGFLFSGGAALTILPFHPKNEDDAAIPICVSMGLIIAVAGAVILKTAMDMEKLAAKIKLKFMIKG